jgi:hypothetical protein
MAKKTKSSRDAKLSQRSDSETRDSRESMDRAITENRELTDDVRLDEFRQAFFQSALPDLPEIPGYHVCWLTTQNPRDSIIGRMRLGYEPIRAEEIPGWSSYSMKTGELEGAIAVNEMVAFKLPNHLYQMYMAEAHHHQPNSEEQKLVLARQAAEETASQASRRAVSFELEEGMAEIGQSAPKVPTFR